jgi:hypothetical protein
MSARERSDCVTVSTTCKRLHRLPRDRLDKRRATLGSDVTYTGTAHSVAMETNQQSYITGVAGQLENCLLDGP